MPQVHNGFDLHPGAGKAFFRPAAPNPDDVPAVKEHSKPSAFTGAARDASYYLGRIAASNPSMLGYWDRALRCRFANQAYAKWFGIDPAALIGRPIEALLGPDLLALNRPHLDRALQGEEQVFERSIVGKDGTRRHSLAHYVPDIVSGVVEGIVVLVTDIALLKNTEAALRTSEQRFKALADASPLGVYETDARSQLTYQNARWLATHGLEGAQDLDGAWEAALHPDDRAAVQAARDLSIANRVPFEMEFRIRRPDGQWRTVHSRAVPKFADDGTLTGFVGATEDVTERRRAEARLRSSESLLERTGRLAGVGGWEMDLRTHEIFWSEQVHRIHEVPAGYRPTFENGVAFYTPEAQTELKAAMAEAIHNGTPWNLELSFITAKGRKLWVRTLGEVEYEAGQAVRLTGAFKDVTERRDQERELQREKTGRELIEQHALVLDRLLGERNEMLDVMAHEVRQPLNNASAALQSAARVLRETGATIASDRLSRAQCVMNAVLSSIDNTLAVASLLARPDPIHRVDVDVDVVLRLAIADMPSDERDRIRIEGAQRDWTASMDSSLMRLALRNVLANALKYATPHSPITVSLSESDEPLALVIDVSNAGAGIADDVLPRLFQRGSPRAQAAVHGGGGLGLGLYIVRRVMELHCGHAELLHNGPDGVTVRLVVPQATDD